MKILLEKNWYLTSDENQYILSEEKEQNVKNKETGVMEKKKFDINRYHNYHIINYGFFIYKKIGIFNNGIFIC